MVVGAYQTAMSSRLRFSSVAAMSSVLGIECRVHCARDRVCAASAAGVMREEVRVAIATSRNSSGRGGSPGMQKAAAHESQMFVTGARSSSGARS
jgi:hypothetical protein